MTEKKLLKEFMETIEKDKTLTQFIINIFDYEDFHDYNYIFRLIENEDNVIIDIYDNISENRFNRYIFSFVNGNYDYKVTEEKNVFVNYINVLNLNNCDNKLLKFAYLFKLNDNNLRIEYAKEFLDDVFVNLLIKLQNEK